MMDLLVLILIIMLLTNTNIIVYLTQLLLERGASVEAKDEDGAIPLHDACAGGIPYGASSERSVVASFEAY